MLYHYSVTPTPSQGITPPSVLFLHPLGHRSPSGIASLALSFLKTGPCAFLHPLLRALPDHRIRLLSERQLQFTLDVDSSSATGPFFLSIVLFEQNRLEEAEQRAREALLRNPGLALAYLTLADVHGSKHEFAMQLCDLSAYLKQAPESGPDNFERWFSRSCQKQRSRMIRGLNAAAQAVAVLPLPGKKFLALVLNSGFVHRSWTYLSL